MKKGFSKKPISTSLVDTCDSNTYKENGCFSCENGFTEQLWLMVKTIIRLPCCSEPVQRERERELV